MRGVCLLCTGPQIGSSGGRKRRGDWVSLLDSTWPWRGFRARAQESRQSAPATRVEVRTPSAHAGPPCAAQCRSDQRLPKAEAPPAQPVVPPGEPTPHSQRTSSRPQGSRGIGLPGESARGEQGLGAVEAAPKRWLRRISAQDRAGKVERARATPSRVWEEVRCREQAGERDSLPGPFLLLPSLGQVAFSAPSTSWAQAAGVAPTPATPLQVPPTQGKGTGLAGSLPRH